MNSSLLTKQQIAEKLGSTPGIASRLLASKGVSPIDFGRGRSRGLRWYAPAVDAVMRQLHEEAQTKAAPKKAKTPQLPKGDLILGRSINDLHAELTGSPIVQ